MGFSVPSLFEFLEFFGTDPEVLDPEVPWEYNTVMFVSEAGGETTEFRMVPGYSEISIAWRQGRAERLLIRLLDVSKLSFSEVAGRQALNIRHGESGRLTVVGWPRFHVKMHEGQ